MFEVYISLECGECTASPRRMKSPEPASPALKTPGQTNFWNSVTMGVAHYLGVRPKDTNQLIRQSQRLPDQPMEVVNQEDDRDRECDRKDGDRDREDDRRDDPGDRREQRPPVGANQSIQQLGGEETPRPQGATSTPTAAPPPLPRWSPQDMAGPLVTAATSFTARTAPSLLQALPLLSGADGQPEILQRQASQLQRPMGQLTLGTGGAGLLALAGPQLKSQQDQPPKQRAATSSVPQPVPLMRDQIIEEFQTKLALQAEEINRLNINLSHSRRVNLDVAKPTPPTIVHNNNNIHISCSGGDHPKVETNSKGGNPADQEQYEEEIVGPTENLGETEPMDEDQTDAQREPSEEKTTS